MRLALRIVLMTFWTCVVGSVDGTRKCGDGGNGAEASSGIKTVICDEIQPRFRDLRRRPVGSGERRGPGGAKSGGGEVEVRRPG